VEALSTETSSTLKDWAIEAVGIKKSYGEVEALRETSLSIRRGEFFSLLGPSGCGKTTLLRLVAGLDQPDAGALRIGGRDALAIPAHKRPVNTVFQSYALFPHLRVRDNIAFGLKMKKVPSWQIRERVDQIMAAVDIRDLADRYPSQISGGQKQRVALARAVVNEPEVLLLDEPLGALDLKLRKLLQIELHQLQRRLGITFIYVTHDQDEALVMSDRIAVMNAGKIEQMAPSAQLYEHPRTCFVAQFLGSCNLFAGKASYIEGSQVFVETEVGLFRAAITDGELGLKPGQCVNLALRPEKLELAIAQPGERANVFKAQVRAVIYSGSETQYRLQAGSMTLHATMLNTKVGHQGFHEGEQVFCSAAAEALVCLQPE